MFKEVTRPFRLFLDNFLGDEYKTACLLFLLGSIAYFFYALMDNPVLPNGLEVDLRVNYIFAIIAFSFFMISSFTEWGRTSYSKLTIVIAFIITFMNLWQVYETKFYDRFAYQFLIYFILVNIYITTRIIHILFNFSVLLTLALAWMVGGVSNNSNINDFGVTFFTGYTASIMLIYFRYINSAKMENNQQRYLLLAENSIDIIATHSPKGKIEFMSPSITTMMGYSPLELLGTDPFLLVHPEDLASLEGKGLMNILEDRRGNSIDFRMKKKDGSYRWVETVLKPLYTASGELKLISQTRDFEANKSIQDELQRYATELERSNADLESFAYVASHDMQEPLRMITNYVQLLRKRYAGSLDETAMEYIDFANRGALNLQQLVKDLLTYSKIGRADLNLQKIDMNEMVKEIQSNLSLRLQEKNATLKLGTLLPLTADKPLLMTMIQNMIINGITYNNSETPVVEVSTQPTDSGITVVIKDNGVGIPQEHQQTIFELFQRLHNKSEYAGSGIGLAVCKKIIERQGGRIWVESAPGQGSTFYFTIPETNAD